MLPDFEGTPPLPVDVDDEYITANGISPQPAASISVMAGNIAAIRLFRILGECQQRHRTFTNSPSESSPPVAINLHWAEAAILAVYQVLQDPPPELRGEYSAPPLDVFESGSSSFVGMQQANIQITALCTELALVRFETYFSFLNG